MSLESTSHATKQTTIEVSAVASNRLFARLAAESLERIAPFIERIEVAADTVLFREGDPGDGLYLVIDGAVRISKIGRGGQQETLGIIEPGDFFGEMALIDGQPRSARATTAESTVLGRLQASILSQLPEAIVSDLRNNVLYSIVARLRGLNAHFIEELMRTERLSLVGSMANSVIHDLKNPLQIIGSCSDLIASKTTDSCVLRFTGMMQRAVRQMIDMVQELLDFARGKSSLQRVRYPARAVVDEVDDLFLKSLPACIEVVREIDPCPDVEVDLGRFARVLMNLAKNSVEAMKASGTLKIELHHQDGMAVYRIQDTGHGIPPELLPKIFEPFVSHGKSDGTGLGLAIAKSVAEAHQGSIRVESEPGHGTTMEVRIPVIAA